MMKREKKAEYLQNTQKKSKFAKNNTLCAL